MWEISFTNLNMLLATIPVYEPDKEKEEPIKSGSMADTLSNIFKDE